MYNCTISNTRPSCILINMSKIISSKESGVGPMELIVRMWVYVLSEMTSFSKFNLNYILFFTLRRFAIFLIKTGSIYLIGTYSRRNVN